MKTCFVFVVHGADFFQALPQLGRRDVIICGSGSRLGHPDGQQPSCCIGCLLPEEHGRGAAFQARKVGRCATRDKNSAQHMYVHLGGGDTSEDGSNLTQGHKRQENLARYWDIGSLQTSAVSFSE